MHCKFVTVYSGRPQVNILEAPAEVIAALPGMTYRPRKSLPRTTGRLARRREILLPAEAQQYATVEGGKAIRVLIGIVFDNGRQENAEVVILITEDGEKPFAILSWRDDFIGMLADSQQ